MGIPIKLFPLNNFGICSVTPSSARILRPEGELATSDTVLTHKIIPVPMSEMVEPQPEGEMNQATTITTGMALPVRWRDKLSNIFPNGESE